MLLAPRPARALDVIPAYKVQTAEAILSKVSGHK
jgi:hypothetical protein